MKRRMIAAAAATMACAAVAAAPANAATFDGYCEIPAVSSLQYPVTVLPVYQKLRVEGSGFCSGVYNGTPVVNIPVSIKAQGHLYASCGTITAGTDLNGTGTFPPSPNSEDNLLDFRMDVAGTAFQNAVVLTGKEGGHATGRASVANVADPAGEVQKCLSGQGDDTFNIVARIAAAHISG